MAACAILPLEALNDNLLNIHLARQRCSALQLRNAMRCRPIDDMLWILERVAMGADEWALLAEPRGIVEGWRC